MQIRFRLILLLPLCLSCAKRMEVNNAFACETINGFEVRWKNYATDDQKGIITDLLNGMVFVEGGRFLMGATDDQQKCTMVRENEYPVHLVELDDFYICRHEMTYEQVKTFCSIKYIYNLEWSTAVMIKNLINELTGLCFDLPTEAQWEYAARGGIFSKGYTYPGSNSLDDVWTDDPDNPSTVPNELGIFNFGDGRYELCKDYYNDYKLSVLEVNPCYCTYSQSHIIRGGGEDSNNQAQSFISDSNDTRRSSSHISCRSMSGRYDQATIRLVIN